MATGSQTVAAGVGVTGAHVTGVENTIVLARQTEFLGVLWLQPQIVANGAASVDQVLPLWPNAIVEAPFEVVVRAGRADWTRASAIGQVQQRTEDARGAAQGRSSAVIDFGTPRTIAGVGLLSTATLQISAVYAWTGMTFDTHALAVGEPLVSAEPGSEDFRTNVRAESTFDATVPLPNQVRTERLRVELIGQASDAVLAQQLLVQLPDLPSDLDLRIDGGPPIWTSPGPVTPQSRGWVPDANGLLRQTVDVSAALTALAADPTAIDAPAVSRHIVLTARVPGALVLDLPPTSARTIRQLAAVTLPPTGAQLDFTEEGAVLVPLPLPAYAASVQRLTATAVAKLPPERVVPPVGPTIAVLADGTPLAEMVLDPDRAAVVSLPTTPALGELTGVRLPLRAGADGAEVTVLFLASVDGEPGEPLPGAVAAPVTLDPPTSAADRWTTFALPRPVAVAPGDPRPFAAILVTRGTVTWALSGDAAGGQIWRGPPAGPWEPLPAIAALAAVRGRVRAVGRGTRDAPVAPLTFELVGLAGTVEATPTPKGVAVRLPALHASGTTAAPVPAGSAAIGLRVTSRVAGSVSLRDVVATVNRAP